MSGLELLQAIVSGRLPRAPISALMGFDIEEVEEGRAVFAGTTLNQTGQAIETIAITMLVYLTISLIISAFMNWYNRKIALVER